MAKWKIHSKSSTDSKAIPSLPSTNNSERKRGRRSYISMQLNGSVTSQVICIIYSLFLPLFWWRNRKKKFGLKLLGEGSKSYYRDFYPWQRFGRRKFVVVAEGNRDSWRGAGVLSDRAFFREWELTKCVVIQKVELTISMDLTFIFLMCEEDYWNFERRRVPKRFLNCDKAEVSNSRSYCKPWDFSGNEQCLQSFFQT
jgi:hypothetical protein